MEQRGGQDREEGVFSGEDPQPTREEAGNKKKQQEGIGCIPQEAKERRENRARKEENSKRERLLFWNVAGLERKERDFWKYVEKFDFVEMTETWVDQKGWERLKGKLPKGFDWNCQAAKREKKRGRARGGIITGIKEGWEGIEETEVGGIVDRKVKIRKEK